MAYTSADGLVVGWSQHDPDGNGSGGLLSHLAAVALPLSVQDGQPGAVEVLSQRQVSDPTLAVDPRTHHPLAFWTEQRPDPILEQPGSWTARIRMTTRAR